MALTLEDVYKALAANPYGKPNTAKTWKDVNPALPAVAISVFGPPSTSGTYDSFKELLLMAGCDKDPAMKALKSSDEDNISRDAAPSAPRPSMSSRAKTTISSSPS